MLSFILYIKAPLTITEDNIHVLTDSNIDDFLGQYDRILVLYYADWDEKSHEVLKMLSKVADQMLEHAVIIAKADASTQPQIGNNHLPSQKFPTLKFYMKNELTEPLVYDGEYVGQMLVQWVIERITFYNKINNFNNLEIMKKLIEKNDVVIVFFKTDGKITDQEVEIYQQAVEQIDGTVFGFTFNPEILAYYNIKQPYKLIAYQNQQTVEYHEDEFQIDKVTKFILENMFSPVMKFTEKTAYRIFGPGGLPDQEPVYQPCLFLLVNDNEKSKEAEKQYFDAAYYIKEKMLMAIAKVNDQDLGQQMFQFVIGGDTSVIPTAAIIIPKKQEISKFLFSDGELTSLNLRKFVERYLQGNVQEHLKSEPIPSVNSGPVLRVVGSTFKDIVVKNNKDVLIMFHAKWCTHCKDFLPLYEEFAKEINQKTKNIVFAKMDIDNNEVEGLNIASVPTIYFYKADKKDQPIEFDQERTRENLIKFLEKKSTNALAETKSEL